MQYSIPNEDVQEFLECIGIEYGKYNFDNLGIKTYHQFKAQLRRRSTDGRRQNTSSLYEDILIPRLQKTDSIIDVGAGRMAYMKIRTDETPATLIAKPPNAAGDVKQ